MLAQVQCAVRVAYLTQQLGERCALGALRHEIGHGVQSNVVLAPFDAVKGIEPATGVMTLQYNHLLACECEANARSHTGHTGTDDNDFEVLLV